jgi:hypothetical protein
MTSSKPRNWHKFQYSPQKKQKKIVDFIAKNRYTFPVMKKLIIIRNSEGAFVNCFAPNNIGSTFSELLAKAEKIAHEVNGTVEIKDINKTKKSLR